MIPKLFCNPGHELEINLRLMQLYPKKPDENIPCHRSEKNAPHKRLRTDFDDPI